MRVRLENDEWYPVFTPADDLYGTPYDLPPEVYAELVEAFVRFRAAQAAVKLHLYDTGQWK